MKIFVVSSRFLIYLPISLLSSLKLIFRNKYVLIDLDYSLCRNNLGDNSFMFDYKNPNLKINEELKKIINKYNISGFQNIIFSSRGLRAKPFSRKWLKDNNINYSAFFHLGLTGLKIIPIFISLILFKEFVLLDDLSNIKDKKLKKSFIYNFVELFLIFKRFKWLDPQRHNYENF